MTFEPTNPVPHARDNPVWGGPAALREGKLYATVDGACAILSAAPDAPTTDRNFVGLVYPTSREFPALAAGTLAEIVWWGRRFDVVYWSREGGE